MARILRDGKRRPHHGVHARQNEFLSRVPGAVLLEHMPAFLGDAEQRVGGADEGLSGRSRHLDRMDVGQNVRRLGHVGLVGQGAAGQELLHAHAPGHGRAAYVTPQRARGASAGFKQVKGRKLVGDLLFQVHLGHVVHTQHKPVAAQAAARIQPVKRRLGGCKPVVDVAFSLGKAMQLWGGTLDPQGSAQPLACLKVALKRSELVRGAYARPCQLARAHQLARAFSLLGHQPSFHCRTLVLAPDCRALASSRRVLSSGRRAPAPGRRVPASSRRLASPWLPMYRGCKSRALKHLPDTPWQSPAEVSYHLTCLRPLAPHPKA